MASTRFRSTWLRRLVACGIFGLLAVPFATAWSEEKLDPPGDCTDKDYQDLKQKKKFACEFEGQAEPKKCVEADSCFMLELKQNAFTACGDARQNLMDRCFRGGDSGHKNEVAKMKRASERCGNFRNAREECNKKKNFDKCR